MSKNELEKIFTDLPGKSYKSKIDQLQDHVVSMADGINIVGNGREITYAENHWEYKHTFSDGVYIREMRMKKGQVGFSAIHKHSYGLFLLSGILASTKESGVEEFIAPCYVVSPQGAKRVVYAVEDCVIVAVHANPTNTRDLDELAKIQCCFTWEEYDEYLKENKL